VQAYVNALGNGMEIKKNELPFL